MLKLTDLQWCIQCTDRESQTIGSFAYHRLAPFRAVSPVFPDCIGLFHWLKQQGYSTGIVSDLCLYEPYSTKELAEMGRED